MGIRSIKQRFDTWSASVPEQKPPPSGFLQTLKHAVVDLPDQPTRNIKGVKRDVAPRNPNLSTAQFGTRAPINLPPDTYSDAT